GERPSSLDGGTMQLILAIATEGHVHIVGRNISVESLDQRGNASLDAPPLWRSEIGWSPRKNECRPRAHLGIDRIVTASLTDAYLVFRPEIHIELGPNIAVIDEQVP